MPLNTSDPALLNLPKSMTSTKQENPYVEIRSNLQQSRSQSTLLLRLQRTVKDKENLFQASFDISNDVISIDARQNLRLRIDTKNYYLASKKQPEGMSLFEKYIEAGILTDEYVFSPELFESIATEFFLFVRDKNIQRQDQDRDLSLNFSLYILPLYVLVSNSTIVYQRRIRKKKENSQTPETFSDSFGNLVTAYASDSTRTAKWLSFYEKAFTINCKKRDGFYKDLGIGRESLEHIFLPPDQTFSIGGLKWVFLDLSDIHQRFTETRGGILSQLSDNFKQLNSKGQTKREKSLLKIICYRSQQQKQEILLDDNLTMDRMRRLFSGLDFKKVPSGALEVLIYKDKKTILWDDYLYGIRSYLSERQIPKSRLITSFIRILKRKINDWLEQDKKKDIEDVIDFFNRTDFCLKTLSTRNTGELVMNVSETFAYKIGTIARLYVNFKNQVKEESHSLRDILIYPKYDKARLQFVYRRISLGINLSKAGEDGMAQIKKDVSNLTPQEEIPDTDAFNDYSYFFYKGYFQGGSENK
jgi:hypothetical protein